MADTTTELEVLDQIVGVLGGQSGQHETVVPVLQQIKELLASGITDPEAIAEAVTAWLDEHPEATTTVQDGSITTVKLADNAVTLGKLSQDVQEAIEDGGSGGKLAATAEALLGADETAQWATRESTGTGSATVRSVQGAAEVQDGELVPVQIAGIKSVGFNQWDEEWVVGVINSNGTTEEDTRLDRLLSKNFIPVIAGATYCISMQGLFNRGRSAFYDASYNLVEYKPDFADNWTKPNNSFGTFTVPNGACYMKFCTVNGYGVIYNHDICINLSNPALNGTYKPYTTDRVEWTAQTLRAAGSVADVLYSDHVDVRVGVVDLGTLDWKRYTSSVFYVTLPEIRPFVNMSINAAMECAAYTIGAPKAISATYDDGIYQRASLDTQRDIILKDSNYTDVASLKAALAGIPLYYELATPTTTPISPALPMTYCVEQGGSESIIVPTGEISAVPVITIAEGESAAELVMDALACIATPDGPVATANHAINTYLTMGGKLYKVTSAIAVGETITAGTNVTETTVMAELIARTA